MESDDEQDGVDVTEEFFRQTYLERQTRHGALYGYFQRFIPEQTILYIQYCLLRIPFLLVYDYSFTDQFSRWSEHFFHFYSFDFIDDNKNLIYLPIHYLLDSSIFHGLIQINLNLSIPILGLILLTVLLLCTDRQLVIFYSYFTSFLVIYFHYQMHRRSEFHLNLILLQIIFSSIYVQMLNLRPNVYSTILEKRFVMFSPVIFIITRFLLPSSYGISLLNTFYVVWALVHLSEVLIDQREKIFFLLRTEFLNEIFSLYQNLGIQMVFNYLQEHIRIVTLLKIFWLTKTIVSPLGFRQTFSNPYLTLNKTDTSTNVTIDFNSTTTNFNETLSSTVYFTMLYYGTETVFTLISLACLVSYVMKIISHRLFRLLHLWNEEVEQIGTVIGVMFFLLLFQSNLTRLDLHRRHVPLLKAFSLLTVALFHFLHTILEPQLLKVAMQTMTNRMAFEQNNDQQNDENSDKEKNVTSKFNLIIKLVRSYHHRHVYTCISILILLIFYIILLWRLTTFSTWLLAITAFSLELIVRLTASLAQYTIYVLDAHGFLIHVDSFDEYIFRIKAVTSCFEFVLGVFLLFNGFYILFFEARGALRAFMLAIHAYLNIIKNFRRGWQILRNRRSAWDNVNQLPLATEEQIDAYNDICAICHNLLTVGNTCITPCSHIFHKKCLQKAFYATQNCALCSRPIVNERTEQQQQQQQQRDHRQ